MKVFYVDGFSGWFLVRCRTKRIAKSEGVATYGRGMVKDVRVATEREIKYYLAGNMQISVVS